MAFILALANQKGGVGKTTTTVNLAAALVEQGKRVLIVDSDPQGNASTGLGFQRQNRKKSLYGVLIHQTAIHDALLQCSFLTDLHLIPATVDLAGAEIELVNEFEREKRLKKALAQVISQYDYILIDCPPSLGLLTINALVAADRVVVPLQAEFYALEGLSYLLRTVKRVRKTINSNLKVEGVVLTMTDSRTRLTQQVEQDVRTHMGPQVYQTTIPRNVRVSESPSHGLPVLIYDRNSAGAAAYIALAGEFLDRNGG